MWLLFSIKKDSEEPVHIPEAKLPGLLRSIPVQQSTVSLVPVYAPIPECMDISEDKPEAFSKTLLKVQDIDANDKDNPQLVSEYVNDIYNYMRHLEVCCCRCSWLANGTRLCSSDFGILVKVGPALRVLWLCTNM